MAYPSPFDFRPNAPITLVELRMWYFSGKARSKPGWWEKVHDTTIAARWRSEMLEHDSLMVEAFWGGAKRFEHDPGEKQWPRDPITDAQLDYIFESLRYEAVRYDKTTGIYAAAIPKVYESWSLIGPNLKDKLSKLVTALEVSVPEEEKDWHPGSNNQVLDLVRPSLHCRRIGESYVKTGSPAHAQPLSIISSEEYMAQRSDFKHFRDTAMDWAISDRYQWLPTDFSLAAVCDRATALSYINGLHPIHHLCQVGRG